MFEIIFVFSCQPWHGQMVLAHFVGEIRLKTDLGIIATCHCLCYTANPERREVEATSLKCVRDLGFLSHEPCHPHLVYVMKCPHSALMSISPLLADYKFIECHGMYR